MIRKGRRYVWKPSSSSKLSICVVRAYHLAKLRQTVPYGAIRADYISVNSILPTLNDTPNLATKNLPTKIA